MTIAFEALNTLPDRVSLLKNVVFDRSAESLSMINKLVAVKVIKKTCDASTAQTDDSIQA